MGYLNKSIAFLFLLLFTNISGVKCQNTFKKVYDHSHDASSVFKLLYQDSTDYKIYSIDGLLKVDTLGNINTTIKSYNQLGISCSAIKDKNIYSFCNNNSYQPFFVKSSLNLDSIIWVKTYLSNTDTLSCINLSTNWNNSLLYSGPRSGGQVNLYPEFGEIDTSGHILRSFKDSTIHGYCIFNYLLDSSTYLVGINSSFGPILLEIDTIGNIIYQKKILNRNSVFTSSVQNANKEVTIMGVEDNTILSNIFILNYSLGGITNWSKEITLLSSDYYAGYAPTITNCTNGGYLVTATGGLISPFSYEPNLELIKLNAIGDSLWSISHGSTSSAETGITSIETSDLGFLSFGSTSSSQFNWITNPIPYIIKSDSLGHTSTNCQESYFPFTINNLAIQDSSLNLNFHPITYQDSSLTLNFSSINNIQSLDGCTLSTVEQINSKKQQNDFSIYPNPAKDKLRVQCLSSGCKIINLEIFNLKGQLIKSVDINHLNEVDIIVSFLEKASYLIKISSDNNSEIFSFIKE